MAQKREKDETLDLKVPTTDAPLSLSCKIPNNLTGSGPDPAARIDPGICDKAEPSRPRSEKVEEERGGEEQQQQELEVEPESQRCRPAGEEPVAKRAVNRCSGCGKRVGLTGFRCRCGDLFCWEHRYSDRHDCSFDYKAAGREAIARENPVVRAAKILKV